LNLRAFFNVRPHVISGHPFGLECATKAGPNSVDLLFLDSRNRRKRCHFLVNSWLFYDQISHRSVMRGAQIKKKTHTRLRTGKQDEVLRDLSPAPKIRILGFRLVFALQRAISWRKSRIRSRFPMNLLFSEILAPGIRSCLVCLCATQPVSNCRGTPVIGIQATWPVEQRIRF